MSWKDFPQLKTRRGNHDETSKRSRDVAKPGPYSQVATNKWGRITIAEVLRREKGSCRGKTRPQKPGFENQQVSHSEDPGDGRGHRLHSCRAHRKPHMPRAQGRGSTWEEAGLGTLADLGEPPGEAGGTWDSSWGRRRWRQAFGELVLQGIMSADKHHSGIFPLVC